jgi:hypothetical protein
VKQSLAGDRAQSTTMSSRRIGGQTNKQTEHVYEENHANFFSAATGDQEGS